MSEGNSNPGFIAKILKQFRKTSITSSQFEEEINDLLDYGAESGAIPKSTGEMIQSIVEFSDTVAKKIMTPRIDIVGLDLKNCDIGGVVEVLRHEGYSRLPVYEEDMDHVIGFIMAKDVLQYWDCPKNDLLPRSIIRPVTFVHANKKIEEILAELRHKKSHMAIVLDEYGGTAGLITMEDIIEEIVGDIHDEYDLEEDKDIEYTESGQWLASGQVSISDLNDSLGQDFPEGDYDTLGGFLTNLLGGIPEVNREIIWNHLKFTVLEADERKVDKVSIEVFQDSDEIDGEN